MRDELVEERLVAFAAGGVAPPRPSRRRVRAPRLADRPAGFDAARLASRPSALEENVGGSILGVVRGVVRGVVCVVEPAAAVASQRRRLENFGPQRGARGRRLVEDVEGRDRSPTRERDRRLAAASATSSSQRRVEPPPRRSRGVPTGAARRRRDRRAAGGRPSPRRPPRRRQVANNRRRRIAAADFQRASPRSRVRSPRVATGARVASPTGSTREPERGGARGRLVARGPDAFGPERVGAFGSEERVAASTTSGGRASSIAAETSASSDATSAAADASSAPSSDAEPDAPASGRVGVRRSFATEDDRRVRSYDERAQQFSTRRARRRSSSCTAGARAAAARANGRDERVGGASRLAALERRGESVEVAQTMALRAPGQAERRERRRGGGERGRPITDFDARVNKSVGAKNNVSTRVESRRRLSARRIVSRTSRPWGRLGRRRRL